MRNTMIRRSLKAAAVSLALLYGACQKSEVVAPDGSTLSLSATPATILTAGGTQTDPVFILATVRNSIGVPLPGQDVRFTNTSGSLDPQAGLPVPTDSNGNALTTLTGAKTTTTITATAGKATATLTLNTASCSISGISINTTPQTFTSCNDRFDIIATVTDTTGAPCVGVIVTFDAEVPGGGTAPDTDVSFKFQPPSNPTDSNGQITTTISLGADCSTDCVGGKPCNSSGQQAVASGGGVKSSGVTLTVSVP
jgi:hypothetical protein